MRLVADGASPARQLISSIVSLQDVEKGFHTLESGGVMKVLIDCRQVTA